MNRLTKYEPNLDQDLLLVDRQHLINWQASYQQREADSYRQGVVFGVAVAVVVLVCSAIVRAI